MAANGYSSGITEVGQDAVPVCPVPQAGVRVRNLGGSRIYLGGPDVDSSAGTGYPVDPGASEDIPGATAKETPVVPAPEGDMEPPVLWARAEPGAEGGKLSWISVSMA